MIASFIKNLKNFLPGLFKSRESTLDKRRFMKTAFTSMASCAALIVLFSNLAQAQITSIFAGTGTAGYYAGDNNDAATARLNGPRAITFDAAGNMYIADANNYCIRKIDVNGKTSVVAGIPQQAGSQTATFNNLNATSNAIPGPNAIAMGPEGNIYALVGTSKWLKVTPSGMMSMYNLTATSYCIVATSTYVYSGSGGRVYKYNVATGAADGQVLTTGISSEAKGMDFDTAGNIVGINGLGELYRIDLGSGTTTKITTNIDLATNTGGLKVDQNNNIYIVNNGDYIRKVAAGTNSISSITLSGATRLVSVAVNSQGHMFAADLFKNIIYKYAPASTNSNLSALSTTAGALSPAFDKATPDYSVPPVPNSTASVTVTPTVEDATATIKVRVGANAYATVASGGTSAALPLNAGNNIISILATAQDGTSKTYTITVNRAVSTNANLSNLTLSQGTLNPVFSSSNISYSASVIGSVSAITVTPTLTDITGSIQVKVNSGNYANVTNGNPSASLPLNIGDNTITVLVTAQDGTTTKTYTVNVTRAVPANIDLANIALSEGTLSPAFSAAATSYTSSVNSGTSSVTITSTAADPSSTIKLRINEREFVTATSGSPSPALALNAGTNIIDILLTGTDGSTKTYTISLKRLPISLTVQTGPVKLGLPVTALNTTKTTPNQGAGPSIISASGRYLTFSSSSTNLIAGFADNNGSSPDFYQKDLETKEISLITHASSSQTAGSNIGDGEINVSGDGRFAVFYSSATNLASGVTGNLRPYIWDNVSKEVKLLANVQVRNVDISADGNWISMIVYTGVSNVFPKNIYNSAAGTFNTAAGTNDYFLVLINRVSGDATLVSHVAGNANSPAPVQVMSSKLSGDGRYTAFQTWLVVPAWDASYTGIFVANSAAIYIYDRTNDTFTLVTKRNNNAAPSAIVNTVLRLFSEDGRYLFFNSFDNNFSYGDSNNLLDLYQYDRDAGENKLSRLFFDNYDIQPSVSINAASMSPDGRQFLFTTNAVNIPGGYTINRNNIYLINRADNTIKTVNKTGSSFWTVAANGSFSASNGQVLNDGKIVFNTNATGLGFTDTNNASDVYSTFPVENAVPVITSNGGGPAANINVAENTALVTTVQATDEDADPIIYSVSGPDAVKFSINSSTGVLRFISSPDFENPASAANSNSYSVTVKASDGKGGEVSQALTITVTNEDDIITAYAGIPLNLASESFKTPDGFNEFHDVEFQQLPQAPASLVQILEDNSETSLESGDRRLFLFVNGVKFISPQIGNYTFKIVYLDDDGNPMGDQTFNFKVEILPNIAPVITFNDGNAVNTDVRETTAEVATLTATDADNDALTWSVSGGADAAKFSIDPATGKLGFTLAPDFENPGSAASSNIYYVTLKVSDGKSGEATQDFTITVTDVAEATIQINNNATYTNTAGVDLKITGDAASVQMALSNDDQDYTAFEAIADKSWTLLPGDGTKTVYVKVKDASGNITGPFSASIILDTTKPVIADVENNKYYTTNVSPTFNEGTAALNGQPYISGTPITADATYTLVATDAAGNVETVTFIIDKTPVLVTGVEDDQYYTSDVTPSFTEGTATLNGQPYTAGTPVAIDGTYTLIVKDEAGNETTVHFVVDKTKPVIAGVENGKSYNTNLTPTFNEGTATLNGQPYVSGTPVTAEGTYTLIVTDAAGNVETVAFTIDKTPVLVAGVEEGKYYPSDVTPTFTEGTATLNGQPYTSGTPVTGDGSYTLIVKDEAGNETIVHFIVDKTKPVIAGVENGKSYNTNLTPTFTEGTATLNGRPYVSGSPITAEGTYTLEVTDEAGNMETVTFTIDKTPVIITGVEEGKHYPVSPVPAFSEGTGTLNGRPYVSGTPVTADGSYILVVTDAAGNTTTVSFNVDKTAPVVTGVSDVQNYDNIRLVTFNEGSATLNGAPFNSGNSVTEDGTYTLVVTDEAGNSTTVHFTIEKPKAPADIILTAQQLFENQPSGTLAAGLAAVSAKPDAEFVYTLVGAYGDNSRFTISGNQLLTAAAFDFETQNSFALKIRANQVGGTYLDKEFTLTIKDVNEAPALSAIADQMVCYTAGNQSLTLNGITAGPETGQSVSLTVAASNTSLFDMLSVNNHELSYRLREGANGTSTIIVTVKDNGGTANGGIDTFSQNFSITVNALPEVNIVSDQGTSVSKGITARLTASGGTSYLWNDANGILSGQTASSLTIRPDKTTTYTVTVTNANGCSVLKTITINVLEDYKTLDPSNLVTPNGDGVNDYFIIKNIDMYPNNILRIYDRAGRLIYNKPKYQDEWNGTLNGSPLTAGTYYYIMDFGSGNTPLKGFITII